MTLHKAEHFMVQEEQWTTETPLLFGWTPKHIQTIVPFPEGWGMNQKNNTPKLDTKGNNNNE